MASRPQRGFFGTCCYCTIDQLLCQINEGIGDAFAPGAIVHAVHSGHRYAREFDTLPGTTPYTRDFPI